MRRLPLLVIGLALVAAACGGSNEAEVATLENAATPLEQTVSDASDSVDDEQALLAFAACMRENGVEAFPDPRLNADGSVSFGTGGGSTPFGDVDNDTAEAAVNGCIGELECVTTASTLMTRISPTRSPGASSRTPSKLSTSTTQRSQPSSRSVRQSSSASARVSEADQDTNPPSARIANHPGDLLRPLHVRRLGSTLMPSTRFVNWSS